MARELNFTVPEEYDGAKLLSFLRGKCGFSSRLVGTLKRIEGGIMLNGAAARTIDRIKTDDRVKITMPEEKISVEPIECELDIIYEDNDILAINKTPYMAMHPTHNHQGDTLANAVAAYLEKNGGGGVFRAVGRLDKGTSGVVICAKNKYSAYALGGKIKKEYLALVSGETQESGKIDVPIYRPDPMKTIRACSYELGTEPAITFYTALRYFEGATLVKVQPETGRTHQIRVHFAFLGMPLAGDTLYGEFMPQIGHQLLHCRKCEFIHPVTKEKMSLSCLPPPEFEQAMNKLTEKC